MFTGIITETGTVADVSRSDISIRASGLFLRKLKSGTSVSVDGACLTVTAKNKSSFTADIMPETKRRTTLGNLRRGDTVNLELPATPNSFLSGHIVQGHVDGTGVVTKMRKEGASYILSFSCPRPLARSVVEKGSIALNGVSLTVIDAGASGFTVGIIPHTWQVTALHKLKRGGRVNIETDVLAKYAEKNYLKKLTMKNTKNIRIGIIGTSFRENVTAELEKNCLATLRKRGVSKRQIRMVRVPGAFEVPLIAKKMAASGDFDALIVFGAIVKGKTYHFEQIANECARGCADVARSYEIPVIFEVLAVYDLADALERATRKKENKGVEAAETAVSMLEIVSRL